MNAREKEIREVAAKALEDIKRSMAAILMRGGNSDYDAEHVVRALLPMCSTAAERECVEAALTYAKYIDSNTTANRGAFLRAAEAVRSEREPQGPWRQDGHSALHDDGREVAFYAHGVRDAEGAAAFVREQNAKERGK